MNNRVHITIVEEKSKFGPGSPYDWDAVRLEHLANTYFLNDLSIVSDGHTDFADWVSRVHHITGDPEKQVEPPPPRWLVGYYLHWKFQQLVQECRKMYSMVLLNGTSAGNVSRGDSGFIVQLSDHSEVRTTDIVLATGHWTVRLFDQDIPGFFPSPWPASNLTDPVTGIPANAKVGIRGDGQNAIDAIMTLAHEHGSFAPAQQGFTYKPNANDFLITLYSRTGHLPAVSCKTYEYDFQETNKLDDDLLADSPSLEKVVSALRTDLARSSSKVSRMQFVNAKQFIEDIDAVMYDGKAPKQRLEKDINEARESWKTTKQYAFQSFFKDVNQYFDKYLPDFTLKEKFTFQNSIAPNILNYAQPVPLLTAEKLHALMEASRLIIVEAGNKRKIEKDTKNKGVKIKYRVLAGTKFRNFEYSHPYFIDALEQSGDIKSNPSLLVQSLFENKFIQPNFLPLADNVRVPDAERVERISVKQKDQLNSNKAKKVQQEFYRADGIQMDMNTMRVTPPEEGGELPGVIYATGPFAYGQHAFAPALTHVVESAELAAADIVEKRFPTYPYLEAK